jgi:hypothetical protein
LYEEDLKRVESQSQSQSQFQFQSKLNNQSTYQAPFDPYQLPYHKTPPTTSTSSSSSLSKTTNSTTRTTTVNTNNNSNNNNNNNKNNKRTVTPIDKETEKRAKNGIYCFVARI